MRRHMAKLRNSFTPSSGNVFADLGFADAEELDTKTRLGVAIAAIIRRDNLKQSEIGKKLAISQPKVSALVNHRFDGFSVERLIHFLTRLECEVTIEIAPSTLPSKKGCVKVSGAGLTMKAAASFEECHFEAVHIVSEDRPTRDRHLIHTLAKYACAFGLDQTAAPTLLPRMT
jgi:predicted XRE-type DNA-binding protein